MPRLQHAETHDHYLPKQRDVRVIEAERLASDVNRLKVEEPSRGQNVYDTLVDELVKASLALSKLPEHEQEPHNWTCAQRVVWRSSNTPYGRRIDIVNDRTVASEQSAYAIVNAGRWIVNCPSPGCYGAQYASHEDRRYWCVNCENRMVGGQWIRVVWPQDVDAIERALSPRPAYAQHWLPGETTDELMKQEA